MNLMYEKACVEAGLSEEKIKEIRRVFDADYKALKRENSSMKENGIVVYSMNSCDSEEGYLDIPDYGADPEEIVERKLEFDRLDHLLKGVGADYKELILTYYDSSIVFRDYVAAKGMTYGQAMEIVQNVIVYLKAFMYK